MAQASKTKAQTKKAPAKKTAASKGKTLAAKQAEIKITQKRSFGMKSIKLRMPRRAAGEGRELRISTETLRGLNKWFALFYGAAALATALFALPYDVPLQIAHLAKDELLSTGTDPVYGYAVTQLGSISLQWVLATLLALLAITHGLFATKLRSQLERELGSNKATAGWLFGGVLYGLGMVALLLLVGGYDVLLLGFVFAASVVAGVAGWLATRTGTWLRAGLVLMTALALLPLAAAKLFLLAAAVQGAGLPLGTYITVTTAVVGVLLLLVGIWLHHLRKGVFARAEAWASITTILIFVFTVATAGQIFAGVLW